jgi:hypothetical protein
LGKFVIFFCPQEGVCIGGFVELVYVVNVGVNAGYVQIPPACGFGYAVVAPYGVEHNSVVAHVCRHFPRYIESGVVVAGHGLVGDTAIPRRRFLIQKADGYAVGRTAAHSSGVTCQTGVVIFLGNGVLKHMNPLIFCRNHVL